MSSLNQRDVEHIFESLRAGLVPERGVEAFAQGIDRQRGEIDRQLDLAASGEGSIKFLRGGYGCGKTFMARLAVLDAQAKGFATSFVVVSDNDLRFHRFDDVYRKVMTELGTASCQRGALGDILDRWIGKIEDALIAAGADADAQDFDAKVSRRLNEDLMAATGGNAPQDFVRAIQTIFDLKQKRELNDAGSLISWLSGSANVGAAAKRLANVKGDIESRDALDYLRGALAIVKAAGYKGLVIVIDEAETILRMRKDSRHKSLNGIRQIADAASSYHGLLWVFTGTPDFFDSRQGVAGLAPLHERIAFMKQGTRINPRQPQLELVPFDAARLRAVAVTLRDLYPTKNPERVRERLGDGFIERLVTTVTAGFKGDVGVVPRQFLRALVNQLDLVDDDPAYDPMREYGFDPAELKPEEELAIQGQPFAPSDPDEGAVPVEEVF
jgi:hypothetical protein